MDNYTHTLDYTSATARGSEEEWTWILILMMASLLLALGGSLRQFQHVFRFPARASLGRGRGEWNINSFRRATSQSRMSGTRVRFSHLVVVHRLNDADEDRRASWMSLARDRHRFKRRIDRLSIVLDRILTTEHRLKVAARNTKI